MVRITEQLVRKKSEHNEGEISTLEELSLHQEDIERIENLDKWCRQLKILYLQSNLIPKIENVGRLKNLKYLNLALNNVERVENLEGCESLEKLDLTVNFVGELTSIECLKELPHFGELYLTGNPCAQFEGYREFVIAALPSLKSLDGQVIEKSERIKAVQDYGVIRARIVQQQLAHKKHREKEKEEARLEEEVRKQKEEEEEEEKKKNQKEAGFDGRWYTDINKEDKETRLKREQEELERQYAKDKEFWDEKSAFTPESRIQAHKKVQEQKERETKKELEKNPPKKPRRLFNNDGKPLNVNEAKIDFTLTEDEKGNNYLLDYHCYKHLDTAMIDVDVQTNYVKIVTKGNIFQLCLDEEVKPDTSTCKRSQVTGHLLVTMPKAKQIVQPILPKKEKLPVSNKENTAKSQSKSGSRVEKLEVDASARKTVDIGNIVKEKVKETVPPLGSRLLRQPVERENSENFIDDPDVPPLS